MKRELRELAGLMGLEEAKMEVEKNSIERCARRCSIHFTKKVKKTLFEEIDNMAWSGSEREITKWCRMNKVYDEIADREIDEIWQRDPDDGEPVRSNGKYVWETAKRVCDFINANEDIIRITTFGEYREVMLKVVKIIREAHNIGRKRRQTAKKRRNEETTKRTQRAKTLIATIKKGGFGKDEISRMVEEIFRKGSSNEIEMAATKEKIVERIEELSKKEEQIDAWEKTRREFKKRQREDRRLNLFWRKTRPSTNNWAATMRPRMQRNHWLSGNGSTTMMSARGGETI